MCFINYPCWPAVIPGVLIKWRQEIRVEEGIVTIETKIIVAWPQAKEC